MVLILFYPTSRIKETNSVTVGTRHFMSDIVSIVYYTLQLSTYI